MDVTDGILFLIFLTMVAALILFVRHNRTRAKETQMMQSALYAIANRDYFSVRDPVPVAFDKSTNNTLRRLQQTSVDLQGMIELGARWAVLHMPPEALEDMNVPEDWAKIENK